MTEESLTSAHVPASVQTPKQLLSSYIPLEQERKSFRSSASKHFTKSERNHDSPAAFGRGLVNGHVDSTVSNSAQAQVVSPIRKSCWNRVGIIRLHEEIKAFHDAMIPLPKDQLARDDVVNRIRDAIKCLWSSAKVEVFGSFRTGLYLPSSDVDLVVFGCWNTKPLHTVKNVLVQKGICDEEKTDVLDKASVPIIKMTDKVTGIKVDIAFNVTNGITSAELIQDFLKEFPSLPYIVLILKQFVYQRDLNEVFTGGIGSYSLILLVVSFLQLQTRAEGRMKDVNFGVQLIEFFELYGLHFNYHRTGISVAEGGKYIKKEGDALGQMSLYIQDPISRDNDVARGTYNITQIQAAFSHAYHALCYEVVRLRDDASSYKQPILSCIINFECDMDSRTSFCEFADRSLQLLTPDTSSRTDYKKTPNTKPEWSNSKDCSKNSGRKRNPNYSGSAKFSGKKRSCVDFENVLHTEYDRRTPNTKLEWSNSKDCSKNSGRKRKHSQSGSAKFSGKKRSPVYFENDGRLNQKPKKKQHVKLNLSYN